MRNEFWSLDKRGWLAAVALWLVAGTTQLLAQGNPVTPIGVPEGSSCSDWLYDTESGRLFATVHTEKSGGVVEFDPSTGKQIRRLAAGASPRHMALKKSILVVSDNVSGDVHLFDLEGNKLAKKLKVNGEKVTSVFCSKVDNPYVYVAWVKDGRGSVTQIDVSKLAVRKEISTAHFRRDEIADVAMSPSGQFIVHGESSGSPAGVNLVQVDEEKCEFTQQYNIHSTLGPMQAGASNRFWVLGGGVWPLDLVSHRTDTRTSDREPMRKFPATLLALHPNKNLVAGVTADRRIVRDKIARFHFYPFTGGGALATVKLGPFAEPGREDRGLYPVLTIDDKRNRAFYGYLGKAYSINLAELAVPADPLVILTIDRKVVAQLGKETSLPLTLADPSLLSKAKFEIVSGPDGAKIAGGAIKWTPGDADVGLTDFVVKATVGKVVDTAPIGVSVERASIELDGLIESFSLSPKGDRVLAATRVADGQQLVLVDLETGKQLAKRIVDKDVSKVLLTDEAGYYTHKDGSIVVRVGLEDLADGKRCFLDLQPTGLLRLPGGRIVANNRDKSEVLDAETLDKVKMPATNLNNYMFRDHGVVQPLNGAVRFGGSVLDETSGEVLYQIAPTNSNKSLQRWGRKASSGGLLTATGTQITTWKSAPSILLNDFPAVVSARYEDVSQPTTRVRHSKIALEYRNLEDGTLLPEVVLMNAPPPKIFKGKSASDFMYGRGFAVAAEGDRVVVAIWNKLFSTRVPDVAKKLPMPLHFSNNVKFPEVTAAKNEAIKFEAAGGKSPLKYSLAKEVSGFSIDETTGQLTIDGAAVWSNIAEGIKRGDHHRVRFPSPGSAPVDTFPLRAEVTVTDSENASDVFPISVDFKVDPDLMAKVLKPLKEAQEKAREAAQAREAAINAPTVAQVAIDPQLTVQVLAMQERLKGLEEVFERMEKNLAKAVEGPGTAPQAVAAVTAENSNKGGGSSTPLWILAAAGSLVAGTFIGRSFRGGAQKAGGAE